MKILVAFLLAAMTCAAQSFEGPVTKSEAAAVFTKAEHVMKGVLRYKATVPAFPNGSGTATRDQILSQLMAMYDAVYPKFKFTPPKQESAPTVISFKDPKSKAMAEKLEIMGFVDRYGPLVTSKAEGMQLDEFGDMVGYFIARVAELTHTPSSKFSPYLMPP